MTLPPGIKALAGRLPKFLIPSLVAYTSIQFLQNRGYGTWLPRWAAILLVVLAKPIEFYISDYISRLQNENVARRHGAKVVPTIQESPQSTVTKLLEMFEHGYPGDVLTEWASTYGNIYETRLYTERFTWTTEPEHVKAILATQFDNFPKEPLFLEQAKSLLGDGIFNVDGEKWKLHRAMTRPFFTRDGISDFDIFEDHAGQALKLAGDRLAAGYPIDFQDLAARFTLDSASVYLFSEDLKSLQAGLAYPYHCIKENSRNSSYHDHPSNAFSDAFLAALTKGTRRTFFGTEWPFTEFWSDAVKPHRNVVDRFAENVIRKRAELLRAKSSNGGSEEYDTLVEDLLNKTTDIEMIKDELFNMLVAGRDTTSSTLSFAMYQLTQNPEIVTRLRDEVVNKVGSTRRPDYDDIKEMKYLKAFINEVLRLYPPVPINWRQTVKSTVLSSKDGSERFYIPAKRTVRYSVFVMHRRKDLWGPDADTFDPDRFLDERAQKYYLANPFIFVPFNAGPRICLGQQFAYNEISFFLIRLLQQFSEFTFASDAQDPVNVPPASWKDCSGTKSTDKVMIGANLTMYIKGGLWVRMK